MSATGNDMGGTGRTGGAQDPRTLEKRSDQIRADMNQTLDQLQRQYSPGALLDRGMDLFRENGGELQQNLGRSIRENPMPALLTLVGVGWLILSSQQKSRAPSYQAYGDVDEGLDYRRGGYAGGESAEFAGTGTSEMGLGVASGPRSDDDQDSYATGYGGTVTVGAEGEPGLKDKLGEKASAAGERMRGAKDAAGERVRGAKDAAAQRMHAGRDRIAERGSALADNARMQSGRAKEGFERMLEEQPLVVGAIGVAIGAVLGALIPESQKERQLMGDARENAMGKARELGQQGYQVARETASKAAAAAKDATAEDRDALKSKIGAGGSGAGGSGGAASGGGAGSGRSAGSTPGASTTSPGTVNSGPGGTAGTSGIGGSGGAGASGLGGTAGAAGASGTGGTSGTGGAGGSSRGTRRTDPSSK